MIFNKKKILNKKFINNIYINDFYFKKSKILNLRSRSWFKIHEINNKFNLINKNINVIDLGSHPGGFSQYLSKYIGKKKNIFACDIINMKNIKNVKFINGDITKKCFYKKFITFTGNVKINLIISDMLNNLTGHKLIDNSNNLNLFNIVINMCFDRLCNKGSLIIKIIDIENIKYFKKKLSSFKQIFIFKPNSSRKFSKEFYIIAKKFINY